MSMERKNVETTSKRVYKKPLITSERLEMSVLANHGDTCTCSGGGQASFIANAVTNWLS